MGLLSFKLCSAVLTVCPSSPSLGIQGLVVYDTVDRYIAMKIGYWAFSGWWYISPALWGRLVLNKGCTHY